MNVTKVGKIVWFSEIWGLVQSEKWVWQIHVHFLLTLGRTRKVIPHRGTRGGGGWWNLPPPPVEFLICCGFSKRLCLQWKAFDLLYKMRYILLVVALLVVFDVTTETWSPSWILSRIRHQVKTVKINNFLHLSCKNITQWVQGLGERCVLSIWIIDISKIQLL